MLRVVHYVMGVLIKAKLYPREQKFHERGLSQSTENAILLAGAVVVATLVIKVITAYVEGHLPN